MKPDLATWLTADEAAKRLGIRKRTVVDMVSKGQLHPQKVLRPGMRGAAVSMFDPQEVDRLADRRSAAKTEMVPAGNPGPAVNSYSPVRIAESIQMLPSPVRSPLPLDRKAFLTIGEASEYTGTGKAYIRANITGWKIGPRRSIVYRRTDLDKL